MLKNAEVIQMSRLLVIDDDQGFCEMIADYLKPQGFEVTSTHDGREGLERVLAPEGRYDLILLDMMLPGMNGLEVLQQIRCRLNTPVIILTGLSHGTARIVGLETGADDFLAKPCNPRELLARVRAILRRTKNSLNERMMPAAERMVLGDIELDAVTRVVRRNGEKLQLTPVEFNFLEILFRAAGHIVTREQLAHSALGRYLGTYERSVDTHVSRLRKKLGHKYNEIERIKTIRGVGFVYTIPNPFDA
ncbi:MAG: response regulator transcription factor [Syntrophobacteraceae bacterium]|jgi:two-component system response regulator CpxR